VERWDAVVTALVDPVSGVVTRLADKVIFGASLYTSNGGNAGGTCPGLKESFPALNNFAAIDALLQANGPAGDTPTAESVAALAGRFPAPDPENPGPQIILLATDGNPDNCVDSDAHNLASQQMSEAQVAAAYTSGLQTFVLSVGDDVSAPHLQNLADLGIGAAPGSGTGTPYVANDPAQLSAAFETIIRGVRTCTFAIDGNVDVSNQCSGTVSLNDGSSSQILTCGTDWRLVDENTLELLGAACDRFLESDNVSLAAEFPCGVVVL
jgi:hypothetical protein